MHWHAFRPFFLNNNFDRHLILWWKTLIDQLWFCQAMSVNSEDDSHFSCAFWNVLLFFFELLKEWDNQSLWVVCNFWLLWCNCQTVLKISTMEMTVACRYTCEPLNIWNKQFWTFKKLETHDKSALCLNT